MPARSRFNFSIRADRREVIGSTGSSQGALRILCAGFLVGGMAKMGMEGVVLQFAVAAAFLVTWLGIIAYQIFLWLQRGEWMPITIRDSLHWMNIFVNSTGWLGIDKIIDWLVDCPLSLIPLVVGVGYMLSGYGSFQEEKKRR